MPKKYIIICSALIFLITVSWVIWILTPPLSPRSNLHANNVTAEPLPQLGKPFTLVDQNNQLRSKEDFKGKIVLIYFGYTYCPDICPTTLYNITDALNELGPRSQYIQPLFITVDPARDHQHHIKEFLSNFHPAILGLTGREADINQVIQDYKVYAQKIKPAGSSIDYLIDHTSIVYIYDRQGNFINSFNDKTPPQEIIRILTPYL